jgi:homoserine dehydrogenase
MKNVNIALIGLGTVGSGVYKTIAMQKANIEHKEGISLNIKMVLALQYAIEIPEELKVKDFYKDVAADPDIDIVIELIGGVSPAKEFVLAALNAGKTVVTANKELLARFWPELDAAAKASGAGLYFEASVGGGIPILRTIWDSLQANEITSVMGIINGTTNYILSKMEQDRASYEAVLKEAQQLGFAEANPKNDVEGYDAMYKLSILSSMAFHARVPVEYIYREGITGITQEDIAYADELGYSVKLLAIGKKRGKTVEARVHHDDPQNASFGFGARVFQRHLPALQHRERHHAVRARRRRYAHGQRGCIRRGVCGGPRQAPVYHVLQRGPGFRRAVVREQLGERVFPALYRKGRARCAGQDCERSGTAQCERGHRDAERAKRRACAADICDAQGQGDLREARGGRYLLHP